MAEREQIVGSATRAMRPTPRARAARASGRATAWAAQLLAAVVFALAFCAGTFAGTGEASAQIDWDPKGDRTDPKDGADGTDGKDGTDDPRPQPKKRCRDGQERSADTNGACCWPGQAHNGARCVGLPTACPAGWFPDATTQTCLPAACVDGRILLEDGEHCCWPGQAWSDNQAACIGRPVCPPGYELAGEPATCVPIPGDADTDGLVDAEDACPNEPEDRDGFRDDDGCPDLDNDGDRIADVADRCPLEAEDLDRFEDLDGCPEPDNDGDMIADELDQCPVEAEDKDGFEDEDGCPERDNDKDRIPDVADMCPIDAEDWNDFQDSDGCPDAQASDAALYTALGWSLTGSGVAMAATAVVLAVVAADERALFEENTGLELPGLEGRPVYALDQNEAFDAVARADDLDLAAIIVGSLGGVAVTTGVVFLILASADDGPIAADAQSAITPGLAIGRDGARLQLDLRF